MNRTLAETAPAQPTITHLALWLMLTALVAIVLVVYLGLARWLRHTALRPRSRPGSSLGLMFGPPPPPPIDPWTESARRLDDDDLEK